MNVSRSAKQISITALLGLLAQIHVLALVDTESITAVSGTLKSIVLGEQITVVPGDAIAISPGDRVDLPDHSVAIVSAGADTIVPEDSVYLNRVPRFSVTFHLAKRIVVVGSDGKGINPATLQTGQMVTLHFMRDGSESIVDRIFLQ